MAGSSFPIYAQKVSHEVGGYTMDRSAFVLLFDKNDVLDESIDFQEDPGRAAAKIRKLFG